MPRTIRSTCLSSKTDTEVIVHVIDDELITGHLSSRRQLLAYHLAVLKGTDVDQPRIWRSR